MPQIEVNVDKNKFETLKLYMNNKSFKQHVSLSREKPLLIKKSV